MQNLLLLVSAYRAVTDDWSGLLRAADPPATQCVWPLRNQSLVGSPVAHRSTCFQARERITQASEVAGQNHDGWKLLGKHDVSEEAHLVHSERSGHWQCFLASAFPEKDQHCQYSDCSGQLGSHK